jgi:ADP-ribosylation factor GTPase-activating protein 1
MAANIQREIRELPGNKTCVDCKTRNPQWASVSYGTLMCLECSGKHRSLGVHLSFVRSIQMDSWTEKQIKVMRIGGNKKFQEFLTEKNVDNSMDIRKKYYLEECALYRLRLQALRDGKKPPNELPTEQKKQYGRSNSAGSNGGGNGGGGGSKGNETPMERELRLRREAKERLRAKFGDGGLKGQNTASYRPPASSDGGNNPTDDVTAALSSTFGWLSDTAKKTATAVSSQTSKVVSTVTDEEFQNSLRAKASSTWKNTVDTLNDPALTSKVSSTATSSWNSLISGTQSLWSSVQETAKTVLTPEEQEIQRQEQQRINRSGSSNSNYGGNDRRSSGNVRRSASAPSTDSTDDEWLQQQLNNAKSSLQKEKQRAKSQSLEDDWSDVNWGDTPTKSENKKPSTSVIGRAQELAKEKVTDNSKTNNTKKKEEVSDDDFFGNWGA